jgi:maleylpyruvate isomerase
VRPDDAIVAVEEAHSLLLATVDDLSDADAARPSRLPGWSRGHVLTHLARNADGNRDMVEGAILGEERAQYPGGEQRRADDIEAGATRSAGLLVADLIASHEALVAAWRRMPDDAWTRTGLWLTVGSQPVSRGLSTRRREILVHVVDLDRGVPPRDLPADFLLDDADWLREHRTQTTWPDAPW